MLSRLSFEKLDWLFAQPQTQQRTFRTLIRVLMWEIHRLRDASLDLPFDGEFITVHCSDGIGRLLYYFRAIDENIFAFLDDYLEQGFSVVDVGANVGTYTLFAAKRVAPHGTVFSFEPNPYVFPRLKANASAPNVQIFPMAVGEEAGTVNVKLTSDTAKSFVDCHNEASSSVQVDCVPLDQFVPSNLDNDSVDFLKVDVEGYDYQILLGARTLLNKNAIGLIQIECSDHKAEIYDLLTECGYRICRVTANGPGLEEVSGPKHLQFNTFAIKPDLSDQWIAPGA